MSTCPSRPVAIFLKTHGRSLRAAGILGTGLQRQGSRNARGTPARRRHTGTGPRWSRCLSIAVILAPFRPIKSPVWPKHRRPLPLPVLLPARPCVRWIPPVSNTAEATVGAGDDRSGGDPCGNECFMPQSSGSASSNSQRAAPAGRPAVGDGSAGRTQARGDLQPGVGTGTGWSRLSIQ